MVDSKFYFVQILLFDNYNGWWTEQGVLETNSDYAIYKEEGTGHFEVFKSLAEFKKEMGKDFVNLLLLN